MVDLLILIVFGFICYVGIILTIWFLLILPSRKLLGELDNLKERAISAKTKDELKDILYELDDIIVKCRHKSSTSMVKEIITILNNKFEQIN